jgi:hypothetical protein
MSKCSSIAAAILLCMITACERTPKDVASRSRREYHAIVQGSVHLYSRLHPLRSSRLALYGADSLLFTFAPDEIEKMSEEIERLLNVVSGIQPVYLDETAVDNLTLIMHWLKGERFALGELALHRKNPLLYCWIAEEALYGIPSRTEPPYDGEREAYEKRIARIPLLLANAMHLIENPAKPHVALATERIAALRDADGSLEGRLASRYGEEVAGLGDVRRALEEFSRFLATDLSQRAHGSIIIGSENLTRIFLYGESLTIDPGWIDREGERAMERSRGRAAAIRKRIGAIAEITGSMAPKASGLDSVLIAWENGQADGPDRARLAGITDSVVMLDIETLDAIAAGIFRPGGPAPVPTVVKGMEIEHRQPIPSNPYLTLPSPEPVRIFTIPPSPFGQKPCDEYIVHRTVPAPPGPGDYAYALLGVLYPVRESGRVLCRSADTVRTILSSETFRYGWRYIHIRDIIDNLYVRKPFLELRLVEEHIRALARMEVVFRLHAGTFTRETAIAYLMKNVDGLSLEEARSDYLLASASPSVAYRGISLLLIEEMLKRSQLSRGGDSPRNRLRDLLRLHGGLPLSLVMEKIEH